MTLEPAPNTNRPLYALVPGRGMWELVFAGDRAVLKSERGLEYVAWLLTHPGDIPLHPVELVRRVRGQPETLQQRSSGLDDLEAARRRYREERKLAQMLEDSPNLSVQERAELERQLEHLRSRAARRQTLDLARKCANSVHKAISRLYDRLVTARGLGGERNAVLCRFADHLWLYLMRPSGRGPRRHTRAQAAPGCYLYEPPPEVTWWTSLPGAPPHLDSGACDQTLPPTAKTRPAR